MILIIQLSFFILNCIIFITITITITIIIIITNLILKNKNILFIKMYKTYYQAKRYYYNYQ